MSKLHQYLGVCLMVAAGTCLAATTGGNSSSQPLKIPTTDQRALLRDAKSSLNSSLRPAGTGTASLSPGAQVDVERYVIDLAVSLAPNRVDGTVRLELRPVSGTLTSLQVGLYDQLQVLSVATPAQPLVFAHSGNQIQITLDRPYQAGELLVLEITYGGLPPVVGFGSFRFDTHGIGEPSISSLSEPTFATSWWPCIDDPADKAMVEMNLTVRDDLVGVSNGLLQGVLTGNGTKTYQWRSLHPMSTYLVSVAISNYATWTDFYQPVTGGPPMPVQNWVYQEQLAAAQEDLNVTVPMLETFSTLFGEYPFVDEKYGHAVFRVGGGMEHQTATSYGAGLIKGDHTYDWVVAHELAHQWWGDSVGPADWRETWLNEGFATYSEALWAESQGGAAALKNYMISLDSRPFCGPVFDPSCGQFGHTVYDKGAWALHMLRHLMGDGPFFQGLKNQASTFRMANASTNDLQATMEAASGQSLAVFFDRWIRQTGEPDYVWGFTSAQTPAGWIPYVHVEQIQAGPIFRMPLELRFTTISGNVQVVLNNTALVQDFTLPPMADPPTGAVLDPDLWLLKTATMTILADGDADGVPDGVDNCAQILNPIQADLDGDGKGDVCDADMDGDGIMNVADCAPADASLYSLPGEIDGVAMTPDPGAQALAWNPDALASSYEIMRGSVTQYLLDGDTSAASCLVTGVTSPSFTDTTSPGPQAADVFYYMIRSRNGCGPGPAGISRDGVPRLTACP